MRPQTAAHDYTDGVDSSTGLLSQVVRIFGSGPLGTWRNESGCFWVTAFAPYGYRKVYVQDGAKKRPKLELDPPADAVARRIFDMVLQGSSILDVTKALNGEGQP